MIASATSNHSHLLPLALQAITTPSIEAQDALEVLTDALIEAGEVSPHLPSLREHAYYWAKNKFTPHWQFGLFNNGVETTYQGYHRIYFEQGIDLWDITQPYVITNAATIRFPSSFDSSIHIINEACIFRRGELVIPVTLTSPLSIYAGITPVFAIGDLQESYSTVIRDELAREAAEPYYHPFPLP